MTDFELITNPMKRLKLKLELVGSAQGRFPALRRHIFWGEYQDMSWGDIAELTWKQMGYREKGDSFTVTKEMSADVLTMKMSISAESDVRRIISLSAHMDDPQYFEATFASAWLNRLIRIQLGLWDFSLGQYRWFVLGSYMVTRSDYTYNSETQQLDLSLSDLMASTTEERGNQIGSEVKLPMGSSIQQTLEDLVERFFPFTFCSISGFGESETLPYDLEFERGIYPYEIVKKIVELYPAYEHFYAPDGVYTVRQIPTGVDEPIVLNADQMDAIIISDHGTVEPGTVRNVTEVWGKELDAEYTASNCDGATTPKIYELFVDESFEVLENNMTISFTPDVDCVSGQKIKVQGTPAHPIVTQNGAGQYTGVKTADMRKGLHYVVKYVTADQVFVLQGESEIHAMCFLFNERPSDAELATLKSKYGCNNIRIIIDKDSQYAVEWIGEHVQVFSEGDYANIYTTQLAMERAYYENWQTARIQDVLQLETLYVPWLDVNQKVEYRSIVDGKVRTYLVNSIDASAETFTMTVTLSRYYPMYPWLRRSMTWQDYSDTTWGSLSDLYWDEMIYLDPENLQGS